MLGGHATRIFYMCIAAPRVAFYADSVGAAYTKCAVHLCEMCCRLRTASTVCRLARVHLAGGIMRVFYVIAMPFACAAACPRPRYRDGRRRRAAPAPLRPYARTAGTVAETSSSTATQPRPGPPSQRITLNVPRPATGAVLTVESERPVTYTLYRARHDERAVRRERAPGDV